MPNGERFRRPCRLDRSTKRLDTIDSMERTSTGRRSFGLLARIQRRKASGPRRQHRAQLARLGHSRSGLRCDRCNPCPDRPPLDRTANGPSDRIARASRRFRHPTSPDRDGSRTSHLDAQGLAAVAMARGGPNRPDGQHPLDLGNLGSAERGHAQPQQPALERACQTRCDAPNRIGHPTQPAPFRAWLCAYLRTDGLAPESQRDGLRCILQVQLAQYRAD